MEITLQKTKKALKAASVLVAVFTLITGVRADFLKISFSEKAAESQGAFALFLIWTITFCIYFLFSVYGILRFSKLKHTKLKVLAVISAAVMLLGNVIPFAPQLNFEVSKVHVLISQIASLGLFTALIALPFAFRYENTVLFKKTLNFVLFFICITIALIAVFGAAGITEVCCGVICCIYFYYFLSCANSKLP